MTRSEGEPVSEQLFVGITPQGLVVAELLHRFGIDLSDPLVELVRQQFRVEVERGMAGAYASAARILREHDLNKAAELIERLFEREET